MWPYLPGVAGLRAEPSLAKTWRGVLWVGIVGDVDKLLRLQRNIDSALTPLGFAPEERPFTPHLTLARIRQGASPGERKSFGELVASTSFENKYYIAVNTISLMRSQLTPVRAIYTCLALVELQPQER